MSRQEITLGKIQDNLLEYNDPLGKINKFNSVLLGKQNYVEVNNNLTKEMDIQSSVNYMKFK